MVHAISVLLNSVIKLLSDVENLKVIILKSTVPPGTTDFLNVRYPKIKTVFNPEFLTERNAVNDYENQNRIILGGPRQLTSDLKQIFSKVFPKVKYY